MKLYYIISSLLLIWLCTMTILISMYYLFIKEDVFMVCKYTFLASVLILGSITNLKKYFE